MRRALLCAALLLSCSDGRARPSPSDPDDAVVAVQLISPQHNTTVAGGSELLIRVMAEAQTRSVRGVGHVVTRTAGATTETLDSATIEFDPEFSAIRSFVFVIPSGLAVNAQLDITGLGLGSDGVWRRSLTRSVLVIP